MASWHSYSNNTCNNQSCWNSQIAPVIAKVPVITGEIGEGDCGGSYIGPLTSWLESQHTGFLAWTWDAWGGCSNILITDYNGTPTGFGAAYKAILASVPSSGGSPSPSPSQGSPSPSSSGAGELHAVGAGKCLDDPGSTTTLGTQQEIYTCNGGANQIFTHTSSGQLTLTVNGTTMCLDAYNNQTSAGTKVETWSCNGGANQQWNVNSNGTITGAQSGLCLDVTGASTANGALVELWTCSGGSNQQWKLG